MPLTLTKGGVSASFTYGPEHQRTRQTRGDGSSVIYAGAQEVEISGGMALGGSITSGLVWLGTKLTGNQTLNEAAVEDLEKHQREYVAGAVTSLPVVGTPAGPLEYLGIFGDRPPIIPTTRYTR
ncbi:MAG: hypothetical protein ING75_17725 [Rhodocyclaceae bacterium]|nr:hypothetical protein [Rhodocyclaceae bacterium]